MPRKKARLTDNNPLKSKTDSVLESFSTTPAKTSKKSNSQQVNKLTTQESKKSTSQIVKKSLKKAAYKLSQNTLEKLDKAHLKMQLERGKSNTPYKEVLVELAIDRFLDDLENNPDLVEEAMERTGDR